MLTGSTDPEQHPDAKIARALLRHEKLRARVERVVVKTARGHVSYEYGEPMLNGPEHAWTLPLTAMTAAEREEFENAGTAGELAGWAEVGSRMMRRALTGQDMRDGCVFVQDGIYRFCVEQSGGILIRSVLFEYLATDVYWRDYRTVRRHALWGRASQNTHQDLRVAR